LQGSSTFAKSTCRTQALGGKKEHEEDFPKEKTNRSLPQKASRSPPEKKRTPGTESSRSQKKKEEKEAARESVVGGKKPFQNTEPEKAKRGSDTRI